MIFHLVHALVLTPFEEALPAQTFDELLQEDYPLHFVYSADTGKEILLENSYENNPMEKISFLQKFVDSTNNSICWDCIKMSMEELQKMKRTQQQVQ